jgi:hypothetical protein
VPGKYITGAALDGPDLDTIKISLCCENSFTTSLQVVSCDREVGMVCVWNNDVIMDQNLLTGYVLNRIEQLMFAPETK